ncbi:MULTISPECIES: NRAMP family divalent metal transporter [unclassified Corynebacterium]|uniref:NRAMP family divalent metal transporter n=1 Tax=unclassified Corynebacterium TaxID=2624378 RepID=UPI0021AA7C72|nr:MULTISPECIES: NRAMP family divalent metal transporter [unclassified Corynebacterium]MCT1453020.1 divalent metal cation transporter [Corynebacterium sp. p3-SID1145]MCT1462038.1 divalent metal cation transporter [Corynebacterium sp. p3-SID1140]MDN8594878.1 divalent metal cation transporter [Corynebacterium sp. P4_F2]WKK56477.1 divalent metal cation transporter [Corynebacterium sp. P4-C1]WKK63912.1 divalent metal cation transporter [Corynebacterium sp. P8-C1]
MSSQEVAAEVGRKGLGPLLGAVFLMATSSIGPGFLTQTSVFTVRLGAAFAFAILISILVDIAIQLNVWRVLGISGLRANELGNSVLPGLGWVMSILVFAGGAIFNIGNIAGAGLGMNAMLGIDPKIGGAISAAIAVFIFLSKRAGVALDRIVVGLGAIMILLMLYVAIVSQPPVGDALKQTFLPEQVDFAIIVTLIGGSVGGYITFAGVHRIIDSGQTGVENIKNISNASVLGIVVIGIMRVLLFLAVLGVVATGVALSKDNTAADAFYQAAGEFGLRAFGLVLWAAGLSSVIGASYTSLTFVTTQKMGVKLRNWLTVAFIVACTILFLFVGAAPQKLLIFAGAFNGLILPIGFAVVMWAALFRKDLLKGYNYPVWMKVVGVIVLAGTFCMGVRSLAGLSEIWA